MGLANVPWNFLEERWRPRLARSSNKGRKEETLPGGKTEEKRSGSLLKGGVGGEKQVGVFFNLPRFMRRGGQPEGAGRERRWAAGSGEYFVAARTERAGSWGGSKRLPFDAPFGGFLSFRQVGPGA